MSVKRKHEFIPWFLTFFLSTYGQGNKNLVKLEIKRTIWDFLGGSVVKIPVLLIQVGLVQSMVGKLRPTCCMGQSKKKRTVRKKTNSETKQKEQSVLYREFLPLTSYHNRSSKSHYVKISIIIS